jgi:hypothetical protein
MSKAGLVWYIGLCLVWIPVPAWYEGKKPIPEIGQYMFKSQYQTNTGKKTLGKT